MQGPNGRLNLFVPGCEDCQFHSWFLLCSGLHSVLHQERPEALCVYVGEHIDPGQTSSNRDTENENMILRVKKKKSVCKGLTAVRFHRKIGLFLCNAAAEKME